MFAKAILDGQKARAAQGIAQWIKTRAEITKPHTTTLGKRRLLNRIGSKASCVAPQGWFQAILNQPLTTDQSYKIFSLTLRRANTALASVSPRPT